MIANDHTLHKANIVFLFADSEPFIENEDMMRLIAGPDAKGANFVDDPVIGTKLLSIPSKGLSAIWEGRRLRIEDTFGREPAADGNMFPQDALAMLHTLIAGKHARLTGYGFNFDTYYRVPNVVRVQEHFNHLVSQPLNIGDSIMDFGWQWSSTAKDGKELNGYFLKVVAPLEVAMHHNTQLNTNEVPSPAELSKKYTGAYEAGHILFSALDI